MARSFILLLAIASIIAVPCPADEIDDLIKTVIESAADDAGRAAALVTAAGDLKDSPKIQKVFYRKAYEYGLKSPKGYESAQQAIDALETLKALEQDEIDDMRLDLARKKYATTVGTERAAAAERLMLLVISTADRKARSGQATNAVRLYQEALRYAGLLKQPDLMKTLNKKSLDARKRLALEGKLKSLKAEVEKNPDDQAKRNELILLYVTELDDPKSAAKLINDKTDMALQTYVTTAAKPIGNVGPEECLEMLEWYKTKAAAASQVARQPLLARVRTYAEKAMNDESVTGVSKLKAKLAYQNADKELTAAGYEAPSSGELTKTAGPWIDLLKNLDIEKHVTSGTGQRVGTGLVVKGDHKKGARIQPQIGEMSSYSTQIVFQLAEIEKESFWVSLPVGKYRTSLWFHEGKVSLYLGKVKTNPTEKDFNLKPGIRYTLQANVTPADGKQHRIDATLNGTRLVDWTENWTLKDKIGLGLGSNSNIAIGSWKLQVRETGETVAAVPKPEQPVDPKPDGSDPKTPENVLAVGKTHTAAVPGNSRTPTVYVEAGGVYEIRATGKLISGKYSGNADGINVDDRKVYPLGGWINKQDFTIGSKYTLTVNRPGVLVLGLQARKAKLLRHVKGSLNVTIRRIR